MDPKSSPPKKNWELAVDAFLNRKVSKILHKQYIELEPINDLKLHPSWLFEFSSHNQIKKDNNLKCRKI
jgi:hypothetical protein